MSMYLTKQDEDILTDWIVNTGNGSKDAVPHLIKYWEQAKSKHLFKLFGDKLIHEQEVVVELSHNERWRQLDIIFDKYRNAFYDLNECLKTAGAKLAYRERISLSVLKSCYGQDVSEENEDREHHIYHHLHISYALGNNALEENRIQTDIYLCSREVFGDFHSSEPDIDPSKIFKKFSKGSKIARFFNFIFTFLESRGIVAETIDHFREIANEFCTDLSRTLQVKTTTGTLCVSIHPMDYFTMSDNTYNWCSCMAWTNEGEYQSGTLEMCNSPCVIVAYLKGSDPYELANWNNKKWRELFVVDKDIILGIKGYPYASEPLENAVIEILRNMAKENLGWTYHNDTPIRENPNRSFRIEKANGETVYIEGWEITFNKMYNDCYGKHPALIGTEVDTEQHIHIYASGQAYCIISGEPIPDEAPEYLLYLPQYDDLKQCPKCGYWYRSEDEGGYADKWGEFVCENCLDEYYDKINSCDDDD